MQLQHVLDIISLVFCKLQGPKNYHQLLSQIEFIFRSCQLYLCKQKVDEFYLNPVKTSLNWL